MTQSIGVTTIPIDRLNELLRTERRVSRLDNIINYQGNESQKSQLSKIRNDKALKILNYVLRVSEISISEIKVRSRKSKYVNARYLFYFLCLKKTKLDYLSISRYVGRNDHIIVVHGLKKIKNQIFIYSDFNIEIKKHLRECLDK